MKNTMTALKNMFGGFNSRLDEAEECDQSEQQMEKELKKKNKNNHPRIVHMLPMRDSLQM